MKGKQNLEGNPFAFFSWSSFESDDSSSYLVISSNQREM